MPALKTKQVQDLKDRLQDIQQKLPEQQWDDEKTALAGLMQKFEASAGGPQETVDFDEKVLSECRALMQKFAEKAKPAQGSQAAEVDFGTGIAEVNKLLDEATAAPKAEAVPAVEAKQPEPSKEQAAAASAKPAAAPPPAKPAAAAAQAKQPPAAKQTIDAYGNVIGGPQPAQQPRDSFTFHAVSGRMTVSVPDINGKLMGHFVAPVSMSGVPGLEQVQRFDEVPPPKPFGVTVVVSYYPLRGIGFNSPDIKDDVNSKGVPSGKVLKALEAVFRTAQERGVRDLKFSKDPVTKDFQWPQSVRDFLETKPGAALAAKYGVLTSYPKEDLEAQQAAKSAASAQVRVL